MVKEKLCNLLSIFIETQNYSAQYKIKFTISGIYSKITKHNNKQENINHTEEKNQSKTDTDIIQMEIIY